MGKLSRAEAMEAFEKGPSADTRINFEKEMEKIAASLDTGTSGNQGKQDADDSEAEVLTIEVPQDTPSSEDAAAGKDKKTEASPEHRKSDTDASASQDTQKGDKPKTETVDPLEARLELMEREAKLQELRDERRDLEIEKWKNLARTRASEIGNLRKTKPKPGSDELDELVDAVAETEGEKPPAADDSWRRMVNEELIEKARWDELRKFHDENRTADKDDVAQMIPWIEAHKMDYAEELNSNSPKVVRRAYNMLLREAYIAVREEKYVGELNGLKERRTKHEADLKEKKQGAFVSGGSSSDAEATGKPKVVKSIKDLSDDELRAALNRR